MNSLTDAFDNPQKLVTDVLFNQGYKRFNVGIHTESGVRWATVWARSAGKIHEAYERQALMVETEEIGLAGFYAHRFSHTGFAGDIILSDEVIEAQKIKYKLSWYPFKGGRNAAA